MKQTSYIKGILAEEIAAKKLEADGYKILGRRVKTKYGEIDILAQKDEYIIAVEVKFRKNLVIAHECLSSKQRHRIFDALRYIIAERNNCFESYRIDVIFITPKNEYQHFKNAYNIENFD